LQVGFRWEQTVAVPIDDEEWRIEQADQLLVSYPCVYDTTRRRITAVAEQGRQQYRKASIVLPLISLCTWITR
jgi:hypothetical protein